MRLGVPRSILNGRTPVDGEPYWLPADRDGLLALQSDEDSRCPSCAQLLELSMDDDLSELWDTRTPTCHSCAASARKKRALQDGEEPTRHPTDGRKVVPYMDQAVDEEVDSD
jgi:hypothetical protein